MKNGSISIILNAKSHGLIPANHQQSQQNVTATAIRFSCISDKIKKECFIISYYYQRTITGNRYSQQLWRWTKRWRKNTVNRCKVIFYDNARSHVAIKKWLNRRCSS